MTIKVGINGFGRIGRLTLRAALQKNVGTTQPSKFEFVHINDPSGDAQTMAHLLNFDSVHGRLANSVVANGSSIIIDGKAIIYTQNKTIAASNWSDCDIVFESSGQFKQVEKLQPYFEQGVKRAVVSAPIKEAGALNIVMGVNHTNYDPSRHRIVTAASCTTNCLAPVIEVIQKEFGIRHGSMTTIHDITNTQTILDSAHKDLRRARACGMSLIPTTTGSATAIGEIFPELKGKLNGHAVRVPLSNASLTDCVFELETASDAPTVNKALSQAAQSNLDGILGYEERPLVSIDYRTDPRSVIVDALSTMVVNDTQLKLYLWYDNEWGYANRCVDLLEMVAASE